MNRELLVILIGAIIMATGWLGVSGQDEGNIEGMYKYI